MNAVGHCVPMRKNTQKDTQMSDNLAGLQGQGAEMEGGWLFTPYIWVPWKVDSGEYIP